MYFCKSLQINRGDHNSLMQNKLLTLFVFILIVLQNVVFAQNNHQFTIVTDNDSYISVNNDGYYTNGVKLAYQWRGHTPNKRKTERINSFEIGHDIYTSRFSGEFYEDKLDRPLTGYLYSAFNNTLYNPKEHLLKWGISAGVIGPPAYGKEVQTFAHKIMQIYKPTYWSRQLNSAFGVNANIAWSPQLSQKEHTSKWALKPLLTATAGTFFTNAGAGAALVFGKFNKNSTSAFWNNHKGNTHADREFFGFLFPMIYAKAYDATVQGGMFNNEPEKIPGKLNPCFFQAKMGMVYAGNKLILGATAVYENKQSLTQFSPQYYGSLKVGWMW